MERLITAVELSKIFKVSRDQIYRWVKEGKLQATKLGKGTIRFTEKQIQDFAKPK